VAKELWNGDYNERSASARKKIEGALVWQDTAHSLRKLRQGSRTALRVGMNEKKESDLLV